MNSKKIKKYFIFFIALVLVVTSIIFASIKKKKQENLYNIGTMQKYENTMDVNAFIIFDEFSYDYLLGIEVNNEQNNRLGESEVIENTNNSEAIKNAKTTLEYLSKIKSPKDRGLYFEDYERISEAILDENYSEIDLSYVDSLNEKSKYMNETKKEYEKFVGQSKLVSNLPGYYLKQLDGYESIYNFDSVDKLPLDFFKMSFKKEPYKIAGLKYVNNRKYYLATYIKNYLDLDIRFDSDIKIRMLEDKEITGKIHHIKEGLHDDALVVWEMTDAYDEIKNMRNLKVTLVLNEYKAYEIPKRALVTKDVLDGLYVLDEDKIRFKPVLKLQTDGENALVDPDFNRIFSQYQLKNKVDFKSLTDFDKVILESDKVKEGDLY